MSEHAPFADRAVSNDMTDRRPQLHLLLPVRPGARAGVGLVAAGRTGGRRSLDDFMRRLWQEHGRPGGPRPGYVSRPYTLADLRAALVEVSGDRRFADEFFDRYIEGRDWPDFAALLSPAGYVVQSMAPGRGWIGDVPVAPVDGGLAVGHGRGGRTLVPFGTPLYDAGVDLDDVITQIDGQPATQAAWSANLAAETWRPGDAHRAPSRRPDRVHESHPCRRPAHPRRSRRGRRRGANPRPTRLPRILAALRSGTEPFSTESAAKGTELAQAALSPLGSKLWKRALSPKASTS